jgi:hypothetical protein
MHYLRASTPGDAVQLAGVSWQSTRSKQSRAMCIRQEGFLCAHDTSRGMAAVTAV